MTKRKPVTTTQKEAQTVSNDAVTCALAEQVRNGYPIDWNYWSARLGITPLQGAKLAQCIDPIKWPDDECKQGEMSGNMRQEIRRLTEWLAERSQTWTLLALVDALGEENAPYGMKQAAWIAQSSASQAAEVDEMVRKGRYTLSGAAVVLEQHAGPHAANTLQELRKAVSAGELLRYEPGKQVRIRSKVVRDFLGEVYWDDLNALLPKIEPRITWRFPAPQTEPRHLGDQQSAQNSAGHRVYWRVILDDNIKKIDKESKNGKRATVREVIKAMRYLNDTQLPNKGGPDELLWIDDVGTEQRATKKTVSTAISSARKLPA